MENWTIENDGYGTRQHKFRHNSKKFWAFEHRVFQKPQEVEKPKKKKKPKKNKFKNGDKVTVYKGGDRENQAVYIGKHPGGGLLKKLHIVSLVERGELIRVHEEFISI